MCLAQGFKSRLFQRGLADGPTGCARDPDDFDLPARERGDPGTKTPTAAPSLSPDLRLTESTVTIIDGGMWEKDLQ
ncbi:hypothetical protein QBC46DRAFT_432733 [Diplogelasinospora grovesii]|uniref:Uncharacterized protein n=1 Tax=Diplogelasinospora grovesii TaxID=303347 RepID=A0AAN6N863_9PEZI|nr:hypothetical protein QBC46DRAFT_432733 [Diplogelasinospora grovesii]